VCVRVCVRVLREAAEPSSIDADAAVSANIDKAAATAKATGTAPGNEDKYQLMTYKTRNIVAVREKGGGPQVIQVFSLAKLAAGHSGCG